jgi:predicted dehydrogenase
MSERYRALVVGCGRIAGGYNASRDDELVLTHALAYLRHPQFEIGACVDPDIDARAAFSERWGPIPQFATLDEALSSGGGFAIASVCVPTEAHIGVLARLLASDVRMVFAEKPLGGDPVRARAIMQAYESAGKTLAVAYLRRWDPTMSQLRREISEGEWGQLRAATVLYGRGAVNNGSHAVDLLAYLTGQSISIANVAKRIDDGMPGDPTIDATLMTQSGAAIHLVGLDGRDSATFELTLAFERGLIALEEGGMWVARRPTAPSPFFERTYAPGVGTRVRTGFGTAFLAALDDIAACDVGRRLPASSARSALPAIELMCNLRDAALRVENAK